MTTETLAPPEAGGPFVVGQVLEVPLASSRRARPGH